MNVRLPSRDPPGEEMAWLSRRPVGTSSPCSVSKYRAAGRPHVFGHPDRRDGVEALTTEVAVVLVADLDAVLEPGLAHPTSRQVDLLETERHADHPGVVVTGGVQRHRAPSAPDVEQSGAGVAVEAELAAHEFVLGGLGLLEIRGRGDEAGARVGPAGPEDEPVEVVAHVVVVADGPGVPCRGVDPAGRPALLGRRRQGSPEGPEPTGRPHRGRQRAGSDAAEVAGRSVAERGQHLEDVPLDGEVTGHERTRQPEFPRGPQDAAERVGGVEVDHPYRVVRTEHTSVPEAEPHPDAVAHERLHHRGQRGGRATRNRGAVRRLPDRTFSYRFPCGHGTSSSVGHPDAPMLGSATPGPHA